MAQEKIPDTYPSYYRACNADYSRPITCYLRLKTKKKKTASMAKTSPEILVMKNVALANLDELAGVEVHVRKTGSYYESLRKAQ